MKKVTGLIVMALMLMFIASLAYGAALTADRSTNKRTGQLMSVGVAVSNTLYAGAMVAIDSTGYAVPASASSTLRVIGRADEQVDNSSGDSGDLNITVDTGIHQYINNGTTISLDDVGKTAYVVDDQSVDLSDSSGTRPAAGRIFDVDSSGVWVDFNTQGSSAATGGIDTSDLADDAVTGDKIADDAVSLEHLDSGITPGYVTTVCNTTATEADADAIVTEVNAAINATDIVVGSIGNTTNLAFINSITVTAGQVVFTLSTVGGAGTEINYCANKVAQ